jgi:hypothetical protein
MTIPSFSLRFCHPELVEGSVRVAFCSLVPKLHLGTLLVPAKFHFALIPTNVISSRSAMELPQQVRSQVQLGNEGEEISDGHRPPLPGDIP